MLSKIIISSEFQSVKAEILATYDPNFVRFFSGDNFSVDDARSVINEAYIAEARQKIIVIMAYKFGVESQNSLLKIIEEPPRNIVFIIVVPSKNILLPTIRSRLILENKEEFLPSEPSGLNYANLTLRDVMHFLDEKIALEKYDKLSKKDFLRLLKSIVIDAIKFGVKFNDEDYRYFFKLYRLADLNAKSVQILTPLLLLIMQRQK